MRRRGKKIGWPWFLGLALVLLLALWPLSYWRQPRVMLWWNTNRYVATLFPGSVDFMIVSPPSGSHFSVYDRSNGLADIPFYMTAWEPSTQSSGSGLILGKGASSPWF
jgi:hypothetical protein